MAGPPPGPLGPPGGARHFRRHPPRGGGVRPFPGPHPGPRSPGGAVGPGSGGGIAGAGAPYPHATPEHPSVPDAAVDPDRFRYHLYVQWAAEQQLADVASRAGSRPGAPRRPHVDDDRAAGLYLDLPSGCTRGVRPLVGARRPSPGGFWVGRRRPDAFFGGGQDWGFPRCTPRASAGQEGTATRSAVLRHGPAPRRRESGWTTSWACTACTGSPPASTPGTASTWRYPADELSGRWGRPRGCRGPGGVSVVGEDLGTVPPEVRRRPWRRGRDVAVVGAAVRVDDVGGAAPRGALRRHGQLGHAQSAALRRLLGGIGDIDEPWPGGPSCRPERWRRHAPGGAAWRRAICRRARPTGDRARGAGEDDSPDHPLPPSPGAVLAGALEQVSAGARTAGHGGPRGHVARTPAPRTGRGPGRGREMAPAGAPTLSEGRPRRTHGRPAGPDRRRPAGSCRRPGTAAAALVRPTGARATGRRAPPAGPSPACGGSLLEVATCSCSTRAPTAGWPPVGAHLVPGGGAERFAVWAPNARAVGGHR